MIDQIRRSIRKAGDDPLGDEDSEELSKAELDGVLIGGEPEAAGVAQAAIEEFSQEFAVIIQRFLNLKEWKNTQRIAVGGGFRESRIGELVTGRTAVILKSEKFEVDLVPIHNHPDEAGLLGAVHLAPVWMFKAFDAVLAVDLGGTNIRPGVVRLNLKKSKKLSKAKVWKFALWRHGDEEASAGIGFIIAVGLYLIGLPTPALWGIMAGLWAKTVPTTTRPMIAVMPPITCFRPRGHITKTIIAVAHNRTLQS